MSAAPPKQPKLSEKGREARHERDARLAEALRENLRKRKAQARGRRKSGEGEGQDPESGEA